jgi:hypothetical protein
LLKFFFIQDLLRMYKCYIGCLVLLLAGLSIDNKPLAVSQSTFSAFAGTADSLTTTKESFDFLSYLTESDSILIPLRRSGKLFLMDAIIDNENGNLVFDSGATGLVLNRTYFRNYVVIDNPVSKGITGSVGKVDMISVSDIKISDLSFKAVHAHLAELGHIENKRGVKILGLFGFDLIKKFEINFDPANSVLLLYRIDKKGNRINQHSKQCKADYTQKVDIVNNVLFMRGTIGGKNLRFCFDTGAETNAVSSDATNAVLKTITINRTSKLSGSGSARSDVLYGTMNDFIFGNTQLAKMSTIVTNLDNLKEAYGVLFDGVLGYDFISNGSFCINFVKNQLGICYIKPLVK